MTWKISGYLESTDKELTVFPSRCRVDVFFEENAHVIPSETSAEGATMQRRMSARTNNSGKFEVSLPDKTEIASEKLHFVVSAPSGETIGAIELKPEEIIENTVKIQVPPIKPMESPQPETPKTYQVTGRVIDRDGKQLPLNLRVLLFARKPGQDEAIGKRSPVFVAPVDRTGYFSGDVPNEKYEGIAALVTGISNEITVPLEEKRIPKRILLVADFSENESTKGKKDNCGCEELSVPRTPSQTDFENAPETYSVDLGTGGCVQFNTPNRAIEEFDFYTVVRTTEPDIRAMTLSETTPSTTQNSETPTPGKLAALREAEAKLADDAVKKRATATIKTGEATAARQRAATATQNARLLNEAVVEAQTEYDKAKEAVEVAENTPEITPRELATLRAAANRQLAVLRGVEKKAAEAIAEENAAAEAARTAAAAAATATAEATNADEALANAKKEIEAAEAALETGITPPQKAAKNTGRSVLDAHNSVDWDDTPTFYESAEIAHGHLLHFKQVWYADGYSLGDLLYSLPLAPGQKKLISVIDWERREQTRRTEGTFSSEELQAAFSRDRDLGEVVTGALTESSRGGSSNTTVGAGVGTGVAGNGSYQGLNFGALLGVSGGYGQSNSSAWQESARNLSSNSLQTLRDHTLQSASAVRGLRSSVVHTVAQGEAVRATTEVVANHNHCHALTIQYFEVLRHLKVAHELAHVQECLFVPLPAKMFDRAKVLRWRQALQIYLQRRELIGGFDATRRVVTNWSEGDFPANRYADEKITSISGEFQLTVMIPLPPFPDRPKPKVDDPADVVQAFADALNPTTGFLGVALAVATGGASLIAGVVAQGAAEATKIATQGARYLANELFAQPTPQERYDKFQHDVMPGVVAGFVNQLELWARNGTARPIQIPADFTLVSEYQPGVPLLVSLRASLLGQFSRAECSQLIIKSKNGLPNGSRAIINSATVRYQTSSFEHAFVDDRRVNDDIDLPRVVPIFSGSELSINKLADGSGVTLFTPLDAWEQRSPRKEDQRLSAELIEHLNDNLEFYHHAIWWTMDPNRRYMLLDGYYAPGSNNRSVASVVENRLIGIVGNSLVLPVAHGNHLDPRFSSGKGEQLLNSYKPALPVPPARVSLPTRGVFAEAVMGSCNACEQIDDSRFWRWEESPIDEPPSIDTASTATRRTQPDSGQPTPFPTPIVSIQNAPNAPDPTGVRAALDALGKQSFADITGLAGTQANAAAAYQQALDTAFKFGKEASTLAQQAAALKSLDKNMAAIDKAQAQQKIPDEDAQRLRTTALEKAVGAPATPNTSEVTEKLDTIKKAVTDDAVGAEPAKRLAESVLKSYVGDETPAVTDERVAATKAIESVAREGRVTSVETGDRTTKVTGTPLGVVPGAPGPIIPHSVEEILHDIEMGAGVIEVTSILAQMLPLNPATLLAIETAGEFIGPVGWLASVAIAFVEVVKALDEGLRHDETMGWVYGITWAIDAHAAARAGTQLTPRPTGIIYNPTGVGDPPERRRQRFDEGVRRGIDVITLSSLTEEGKDVRVRLTLALSIAVHRLGTVEGHKQFVTQLYQYAYKDAHDRFHRETWELDWPKMVVTKSV